MSVMTLDWRTKTDLPYGWFKAAGSGQPSFAATGLQFAGADCLVLHNRNLVDTLDTLGTTTVAFSVGTTASSSVNGMGVVPYATGYPQNVYCPWLNAVCNGTALMLSLGIKITANPGDATYQGGAIAYSGLTAGSTGTIVSWWADGGDGNGTITSILKYGASWLGTLLTPVGTTSYLPVTTARPYIGHMGRVMGGEAFLLTRSAVYQTTLSGAAPVSPPTLFYSGYYDNGETLGNYNLSAMVISLSPVQHSMYFPGYKEAVFSPEVRVVLKNENGAWGSFTGYASSGSAYQPPGLFYVRHTEIQAAAVDLFVGFADYNTLEYDALAQTVSVKLQSVFGRMLDRQAVPATDVGAGSPASRTSLYCPGAFGEVSTVTGAYGELGTVTVQGDFVTAVEAGDLIAESGGAETVLVKELISAASGECVFTVANRPGWLKGGAVLRANRPRLTVLNTLWDFYYAALSEPLGKVDEEAYGGAPAPSWSLSSESSGPLLDIGISPAYKFSGNETFLELAKELLSASGGGMGYDGQTVSFFTPSLPQITGASAGTYSFKTVAYADSFKQGVEQPVSRIIMNYGWDADEKDYAMNLDIESPAGTPGKELTLSTRLVRLSQQAMETAAALLVFWGGGATVNFMTDADYWTDFAPGKIIDMTDLPSGFHVSQGKFLVIGRVFDPASLWVTVSLLEVPLAVGNFFRVGIDAIGGSTPVL